MLEDEEDVDGGRAKSDEDVGNGGRDEGPSMVDYVGGPGIESPLRLESGGGRYGCKSGEMWEHWPWNCNCGLMLLPRSQSELRWQLGHGLPLWAVQ